MASVTRTGEGGLGLSIIVVGFALGIGSSVVLKNYVAIKLGKIKSGFESLH